MLWTQKPIAIKKGLRFGKFNLFGFRKANSVDSIKMINVNNRACKTKCLDIRHRPIS